MKFSSELLFSALALFFFIEGLFYAVLANRLPLLFLRLAATPPQKLRIWGIIAMCGGLFILWLVMP